MTFARHIVEGVLARAGITIDGKAPWDITVHNSRFYARVLGEGSLGLGESYMEGWWDCPHLDQFFARLLQKGFPWVAALNPVSLGLFLKSRFVNLAPKEKAFVIGEEHYDLGNSLFRAMLDPTMTYTCGYKPREDVPKGVDWLRAAQVAKLDLVCRKLRLRPGQRVLEIGCGWGSFAHHAATHYGVRVVGLTVSKEQAVLARERCAGLPVEIRLQDYRDVDGTFDHVVSIGMFEAVESKNYRNYMEVVKRSLRSQGLFLLHTIGSRSRWFHSQDPWMRKYIFPIGELPMRRQIVGSSQGLAVRDWHEFGRYYDDPTLMTWHVRFTAAWNDLEAEYGHRVGGQFRRVWEYYLLSCAGSFRAGCIELWQVVLAHQGEHVDYQPVR